METKYHFTLLNNLLVLTFLPIYGWMFWRAGRHKNERHS